MSLSKPSTQASFRSVLRRLKTEFGQMEMSKISPADLQRLISKMAVDEKLAPKTIRNVWSVVSLVWQDALKLNYVNTLLLRPKLPRRVKKTPRFFTLDEVAKIISSGEL
jgi:integrase